MKVVLVDLQDQTLGEEEKLAAHKKGLLHRAFSVFLFRLTDTGEIEYLLQQRQFDKYHCGGLWTNACCSHPYLGEDIVQAGERRLQEEMNITAKLQHIGSFIYKAEFSNGLIEHEFDHVLIGKFAKNKEIKVNPQEVAAYKWLTHAQLIASLQQEPDKFTPWLAKALVIVTEYFNKSPVSVDID